MGKIGLKGEENGYNVCHFYEWRKDDTIELLDQVPLLKVDATLYHYIENELLELPQKNVGRRTS